MNGIIALAGMFCIMVGIWLISTIRFSNTNRKLDRVALGLALIMGGITMIGYGMHK